MRKEKRTKHSGNPFNRKVERFKQQIERLGKRLGGGNNNPISVVITDHRVHEWFHYVPVPTEELLDENYHEIEGHPERQAQLVRDTETILLMNLGIAHDALNRYMNLRRYREDKERVARLPIAERVKALCQLCREGVGFEPTGKTACYSAEFLAKYPDYPSMTHTGGKYCEAFDARRHEYNLGHDRETLGEPNGAPNAAPG